MHARELVELAAVVATQGPAIVLGSSRLSFRGLEQYWVASRCRLEHWSRAFKEIGQPQLAWPWSATAGESFRVLSVLEEVLASEVLVRVWGAVLHAYGGQRNTPDPECFGRGVYQGQLDARNRVLKLLVAGPSISSQQAVRLNELRQRVDRWSDVLVGCIATAADVSEYAPNPEQARQIADELGGVQGLSANPTRWQFTLASLRAAFLNTFETAAANPEANVQIAASILGALDSDSFNSLGLFPTLWQTRLEHMAHDTTLLIDELFRGSPAPSRIPRATDPQAKVVRRRFG